MVNDNVSKRRVLHIAPTPFFADRGCHIRIEGVVNCLTGLGFDNVVCTYHHGRDIEQVATARIKPIKNYTKTEAGPSKYKLWADWRLLCLVIREYRKQRPQVIHAHLHEGLLIGLIVKLLFFWHRTPLVGDLQGSLSGELDAHGSFKKWPFLKWPFKAIEWLLMRFSSTLVCSSNFALQKIQTDFGLAEGRLTLIQDGANPPKPLDEQTRDALYTEFELPKNKVIAVYSGALLNAKGLNELKQIILLASKNSELHFLVIGYPVNELEGFLHEHDLADRCTLTGQVEFERLPCLLQLANIAIDPKFNDAGEGSGKMLNYIAAGLPVIAFDTRNNRDFLPKGTTLAGTTEDAAQNLLDLVEDSESRSQISETNKAHFLEHYSWAVTQQQLHSVYSSVKNK